MSKVRVHVLLLVFALDVWFQINAVGVRTERRSFHADVENSIVPAVGCMCIPAWKHSLVVEAGKSNVGSSMHSNEVSGGVNGCGNGSHKPSKEQLQS